MNYCQYYAGQLISGKGTVLKVTDPATGKVFAEVPGADASQAKAALDSAEIGFRFWRSLSYADRYAWIQNLKESLLKRRTEIIEVGMRESGKPIAHSQKEFERLLISLDYYFEEARRLSGEIIPDEQGNFRNLIIRKPLGVVVGFIAWNYPIQNLGLKLGPALASGCTIVIRPSSNTPLSALLIGEAAAEINFPPGVINILAGSASILGPELSSSSIPGMLTIIGSTDAGLQVVRDSASSVKHFSLELGGNCPVAVLPDADVSEAARHTATFKYVNCGQVCVAPNRVFVHERVYDRFLEESVSIAKGIKLGVGRDEGAQMGPLISASDQSRMSELLEEAVRDGAKIACGGGIPAGRTAGYWFDPTVIDGARPEMRLCSEEIFGPIMPIIKFSDADDIAALCNDTPEGLAAYLYTRDLNSAFILAESIDAGTVSVNAPRFDYYLPHGGLKQSGIGKDNSRYSLEEYYEYKRISIKIG